MSKPERSSVVPWLVLGGAVLLVAGWLVQRNVPKRPSRESIERARFVDDATCATCHPDEAKAWTGTQHDRAMQEATAETVLGDFHDATFEQHGVPVRFTTKDGAYFVESPESGGPRRVAYTFGVDPLQQYLIDVGEGRLQCLTVAWDVHAKRWFDLDPDEKHAVGDELHWMGRYQRWNAMCAQCHSTNVEKAYDATSDSYATTWSAIDVGCQACHGAGEKHVELARANRATASDSGFASPLRHGEQRAQLDACGPCHAVRSPITERWVHGEPFLDHFMPELLRPTWYDADGQMQGEVYVSGSFLQSKMAQRGVACGDCHEPHALVLRGNGDQVCLQCHQLAPPMNRFTTLKPKRYDSLEHTHHAPESTGARCVACHMPSKTFMVIDERHDHSFRVPRPDLGAKLGLRDACTDCHRDRDAAWAAKAAKEWWPELEKHASFAETIAHARAGDTRGLAKLATDRETPAIVRATALELSRGRALDVARTALADPDPLVRLGALHGLEPFPKDPTAAERVLALLDDPLRAVRVEAARVASVLDETKLAPERRASFDRAFAEFVEAQRALDDLPSSHLNLALVHEARGAFADAEKEYARAIELDRAFLPARHQLAQLLHRSKRDVEAERAFRDGLAAVPGDPELLHSLGLLLAELGRKDEAAAELASAAVAAPDDAMKQYDAGLALAAAGRATEAETHLVRAAVKGRDVPEIQAALVEHYASTGDWVRALPYAEALAKLVPGDEGVARMLDRVRGEASRRTR